MISECLHNCLTICQYSPHCIHNISFARKRVELVIGRVGAVKNEAKQPRKRKKGKRDGGTLEEAKNRLDNKRKRLKFAHKPLLATFLTPFFKTKVCL